MHNDHHGRRPNQCITTMLRDQFVTYASLSWDSHGVMLWCMQLPVDPLAVEAELQKARLPVHKHTMKQPQKYTRERKRKERTFDLNKATNIHMPELLTAQGFTSIDK